MQEEFLHYLWKHEKFQFKDLKTTAKEAISIVSVGQHNLNSGPDFFNAQLNINSQLWAGNVEIHVKSSDWFLHNHEQDKTYDNVILHVVWEHDTDVFRKNNTPIATLQLKDFVTNDTLQNYNHLFSKSKTWINCENDIVNVEDFTINNWLERLYFERLERKASEISVLLEVSKNNWESVLFKMLAKNFGLKVNGESFLSIANSIDFNVVRKLQDNQTALEAMFFGQSGLLNEDNQEVYFQELKREYQYLKQKFKLSSTSVIPIQFFRLRPLNFPTIRLSQLASLYHSQQNLFSKTIETNNLEGFYNIFSVETSSFWETHYTFNKVSKSSKKRITKSFIDLLLINTIIPLKFTYAKYVGKQINEEIINLIQQIKPEKNSIVDKFKSFKVVSVSAFQTQALLQLRNEYCTYNKCLQCAIGNSILNRN